MIYFIIISKSDGSFYRTRRLISLLSRKERDISLVEDILEFIEKSGKKNGINIIFLFLVFLKID